MKSLVSMFERCAPGFTIEEKLHHFWVRYNGRVYRTLPLGPHGARHNVEIQCRVVRQVVAFFELEHACVEEQLEEMKGLLRQP